MTPLRRKAVKRIQVEKKPKRRISGEERRAQILRVAGDLFINEGIDHTSMRRIASGAGVTATLLYRHFLSKEDLLKAIGEAFFIQLAGYLDAATCEACDPVERLRRLMRAYVTCGIDNPRAYHLTFMTAVPRLRRGQEMKAFREKLRRGVSIPADELLMGMACFARLEAAVADVVKAKRARVKDVATLSEVVWSAGHGLVALVITHDDFGFSPTPLLIEASIDVMLNGLVQKK
ncbi:MAG: TetR/AcrR family transcriptional regulator [Micropepsaceae bacterium]